MELEPLTCSKPEPPDHRPRIVEPPPVRVVAIEDVRVPAPFGTEHDLDAFYVGLLGFEREQAPSHAADALGNLPGIAYRGENHMVIVLLREPPIVREEMRPLGIEVPSLREVERALIDREWEYERVRALTAGRETLVLRDPAGNWLSIAQITRTT